MLRSKWAHVPSDERPRTALETIEQTTVMFSDIQFALIILATLPVTTAEAERLFSKMERTRTHCHQKFDVGGKAGGSSGDSNSSQSHPDDH